MLQPQVDSSCDRLAPDGNRCENYGRWIPMMRCWPDARHFPDFDGAPSELRVFALVCDRCKELTTIDNVVDADGYRRIYNSFLAIGKVPPRMEDIVLDWEPVIE